mmetsp:Transcript_43995/g.79072  ORF Transcript_43995/g.79072 Transcript_43995/m.79072 type:complete len:957 (-) Transcript_43995:117-2987(-)
MAAKMMPEAAMKLLLVRPAVPAPLDPNFAPLILAKKNYLKQVAGTSYFLEWALPRADGCARYKLPVFEENHAYVEASIYLAGVLIQEMIWQRSASCLLLSGPAKICEALKKAYSPGGEYEFEVKSMPNVCGTPEKLFEVKIVSAKELPELKDTPQVCGKEADGCRLAFDLGKSDIKTVAVQDNQVVYSKETEWDVTNPDPQYHYDAVMAALKLAKAALPRVDAIGGSATGTVSGKNEATWCDIFPNVPPAVYKEKVVDIFPRMAKALAGDVPLKVINDGEVTALAAVQKIGKGNVMGISMGSSEGGGYANADGNLLGWINEMCYIKLDMNPEAPTDPWTKGAHRGISHMYLGQRGATKLAAKAGVKVPENYVYPHPDMCTIKHEDHAQCLKLIQKAMSDPSQEPTVKQLYVTVGVYLGYALAQYSEFYNIEHVMILGRVSKGKGGDIMLDTAKHVLETEFPQYSNIQFHTADDHFKAVGQCIAAAALPSIMDPKLKAVWPVYQKKMEAEGCSTAAIEAFKYNLGVLVSGADVMIPETRLDPVKSLPVYENLQVKPDASLLKKTLILKLNGGLGTGMGLDKAKSLLPVTNGNSFLDLIAKQVDSMKKEFRTDLKFMLMNSFSTSKDTLDALRKYKDLGTGSDLEFVQNKAPKVTASDFSPAGWPADKSCEWCPPGHGDLYPAMLGSGTLDKLLAQGYKYMFVSNSDNLGATMDLKILAHFATTGAPFMMEVAERTDADKKGGHLAMDKKTKGLLLRESAQCPDADEKEFQNVSKYKFFNTNNLWVDLVALKAQFKKHDGALPLPVMKNAKTVDPRDKESTKVLQLETAMGAAIQCFEGASALVIPRSRFAPVKTTNDLLALRSDAYVLTEDFRIQLAPERNGVPPDVKLDGAYKFVDAMDSMIPNGPPSLIACKKLVVEGKVTFAAGVTIKGTVTIKNSGASKEVPAGVYEDKTLDL